MVVLLLGVVIVGVIAILSLSAAELIVAGKGIANVTKLVGKLLWFQVVVAIGRGLVAIWGELIAIWWGFVDSAVAGDISQFS